VNIRWKANKHSYDLGLSEIFLKEEFMNLFLQNSIRKDPDPLLFF